MHTGKLLNNVSTLAIVCTQWGDTGKGKFVDYFAAEWADIIARGTGGANAGHTIMFDGKTHVFHLVPSGILHDSAGKMNLIGSGVAFDPRIFCGELAILKQEGLSYNNLFVALNAKLVLPQHLLLDRLRESRGGEGTIGTTGRGIGPVYIDHVARRGLVVNDLLNTDVLYRKLKSNLEEHLPLLQAADPEVLRKILHHEHLGGGRLWHPRGLLDLDAVMAEYRLYGDEIRELIRDTDTLLSADVGHKKILLEGAQGNLLSIENGTYPYVTSSDCSMRGLARGVGLMDRHVDLTLGIVKAPFMTRVGEGPFPTELGGEKSRVWCNDPETTEALERERYPQATVNSPDEFLQGVGARWVGGEYGSTTRRPRRVGWLDLPLLRFSRRQMGRDLIITKLDMADDCDVIKVCYAYEYWGPHVYHVGDWRLTPGKILNEAVPDYDVLRYCRPLYREFQGWQQLTSVARTIGDVPEKLGYFLDYIERETQLRIRMLSVGPDREQTITCN